MKRSTFMFLMVTSVMLFTICNPCDSSADTVIDQSNSPTTWNGEWTNIQPVNEATQTFTPGLNSLVGVDIDITTGNSGSGDAEITIEIRRGTSLLVSRSENVAIGFEGILHFDFSSPIPTTPGETLELVVLESSYPDTLNFGWKYGSNTYAGGERIFAGDPIDGTDWFFQTYGDSDPYTTELEGTWLHTNYLGNTRCSFLDYLGESNGIHQFNYEHGGVANGTFERQSIDGEYFLVKTVSPEPNYPCWVWRIDSNYRFVAVPYESFYTPLPSQCTYSYGFSSGGTTLTRGDELSGDVDGDGDGVPDFWVDTGGIIYYSNCDNCRDLANSDQTDNDEDGIGDACEAGCGDSDEDEICDDDDNCPEDSNADQSDIDRDGIGDVCDDDNDNDQVVDEIDNCRFVYNPKQEDFDGDGVGEACDNCPKASNVEQEDSDVDGVGDACENFLEDLEVTSDGPNFKPGEDLWLTATFVNNTPLPLQTILPDCFNTTFTVTDPEGNILAPRYRIRQAYAIPGDVVIIPPGPFRVTCNMAEMFDQTVLTSELDGSPIIYDVVATYANDHRDPDLDPVTGVCGDEPCVDLFVGAVSSTPQQVTIQGGPVERRTAECTFEPGVWAIEWASLNSPPISVQIKNIEGHPDVNDVNTATILLNGTVGIIDGSAKIADGVLTGQVERSLALQSLGTTVSGRVYPRVQGAFNTGDDVFYAQCGVDIVDAPVAIDIRPWLPPSFPNLIIRCSWGTLPVAIFSTEEFDATTVDPATVTLAEAAVKLKWNGEPMARVRDVNCDGYRDLVVRFKIKDLNLNPDDTTAYLEGMTFDGIPVVGSDSVKVVDYWRWRFWAH